MLTLGTTTFLVHTSYIEGVILHFFGNLHLPKVVFFKSVPLWFWLGEDKIATKVFLHLKPWKKYTVEIARNYRKTRFLRWTGNHQKKRKIFTFTNPVKIHMQKIVCSYLVWFLKKNSSRSLWNLQQSDTKTPTIWSWDIDAHSLREWVSQILTVYEAIFG